MADAKATRDKFPFLRTRLTTNAHAMDEQHVYRTFVFVRRQTQNLVNRFDGWYGKNKTLYVETEKTLFFIARVLHTKKTLVGNIFLRWPRKYET